MVIILRRQLLKVAGLIPFLSLPKVEAYEYKNDPNVKIDYIDYADFSKIKHFFVYDKKSQKTTLVPAHKIKNKKEIYKEIDLLYLTLKAAYCQHIRIICHFDPNINYLAIYGSNDKYETGNTIIYRGLKWILKN